MGKDHTVRCGGPRRTAMDHGSTGLVEGRGGHAAVSVDRRASNFQVLASGLQWIFGRLYGVGTGV